MNIGMEVITVIHCETRRQWKKVLLDFYDTDWTWHNGGDAIGQGLLYWNDYAENTCIQYNDKFSFSSIKFYENKDHYKIISFEEYIEDSEVITLKRTR